MKVGIACISVALAIAAATNTASAADWNDGGGSLKDMSGSAAVAVPAPVPVPVYKSAWYFRLDAGIGTIDDPDVTEEGFVYGEDGPGPITGPGDPQYMLPAWFQTDFDTFFTLGGGVGYNFGRGFRMDATVEKRSKDDIVIDGDTSWEVHRLAGGQWVPDTTITQPSRMEVFDVTKVDGTVWMANGYYDFFSSRGFTPYIGAGIGFSWNHFERTHENTLSECGPCGTPVQTTTRVTGHADKVSLAAAAMAGISYDVSEITTVDLGYRYLYIADSDVVLDINHQLSTLKLGDQHIHQFRAGLRFNVN